VQLLADLGHTHRAVPALVAFTVFVAAVHDGSLSVAHAT
jgi:hypothetical protein